MRAHSVPWHFVSAEPNPMLPPSKEASTGWHLPQPHHRPPAIQPKPSLPLRSAEILESTIYLLLAQGWRDRQGFCVPMGLHKYTPPRLLGLFSSIGIPCLGMSAACQVVRIHSIQKGRKFMMIFTAGFAGRAAWLTARAHFYGITRGWRVLRSGSSAETKASA